MKPLCLSLGAMALILAFSLWTGWYVHLQTDGWRELLEQAAAAAEAEDWPAAEARFTRAREGWEKRQTIFHTVIEHDELNEAQSLFAAAGEACAQRDGREFTAQLTLLQVRLGLLAETQAISIKNIF